MYAERDDEDTAACEGGGDPWWARKWSLENLEAQGGLSPLDDILAAVLEAALRAHEAELPDFGDASR